METGFPEDSRGTLVVVPCGKAKIWDRERSHGPTPARQVYTSTFFCVNRRYAEVFGESWIILSAKFGFIAPDFVISGAYDVTFKDLRSNPIATDALRQQVREQGLDAFHTVICLGGADYRSRVEQAFTGTGVRLVFPFLGKDLFGMVAAAKSAVATGSVGVRLVDQGRAPFAPSPKRGDTPRPRGRTVAQLAPAMAAPNMADFERALEAVFSEARAAGPSSVVVTAADLHRRVGGYPGPNHRMATCCMAMHQRRMPGDLIVSQPPSGKGASLTIRYAVRQ
jgi:hypothetical protein